MGLNRKLYTFLNYRDSMVWSVCFIDDYVILQSQKTAHCTWLAASSVPPWLLGASEMGQWL